MFGYIYKTTNLINGKYYIGKHQYNKLGIDYNYLGSGKLLKQAIKKYGKSKFNVEILTKCDNLQELNQAEQEWILKYNALHDPMSYNLIKGGDGGDIVSQLSDEDRSAMYRKRKNTWDNNNYSQHMSTKRKLYYQQYPEKKQQISESLKQYYLRNPQAKEEAARRILAQQNNPYRKLNRIYKTGKDAPSSRACICIETQEIFNSATEASLKYGGSYKVIWKCCKQQCQTAAGYHWAFVEDQQRQLELKEYIGHPRKIFRDSKIGYKQ